ncbi:50S ribosomal protein L5P, partial [mine drainage metagenome]
MNMMQEVLIDKVVVNIGVGQSGDRLTKAMKVIEMLTDKKPAPTAARKSVREFNIRPGMTIGTKVTLRKESASVFLKKAFYAKDFKIATYSFDKQGNAYFGIPDYTEFEGQKYDPDIGIFGLDVAIVFKRRGGYRVARRNRQRKAVSRSIRVTKDED